MSKMDFLPMPVDAMFDPRLSLAHIRVLAVIAFHDRRGANGRGCFATVSTMAKEAGYDTRTVKRVLTDLRTFRFISSEKSKIDARRLVHRVVYQSELQPNGDTHAPNINEDRGHLAQGSGTFAHDVSQSFQTDAQHKQRQNQIHGEADPENRHLSYRSGAQTTPSAGRLKDASNDAAWLRQVQEELPHILSDRYRLTDIYDDLDDMLDTYDYGDEIWGWARGIQERMQYPMDDLGCFGSRV